MRELQNKVARDLTFEEHRAVIDAAEIIQKAFGRKIFATFLNPDTHQADEVFSINFCFDKVMR